MSTLSDYFSDLAAALRAKGATSEPILPEYMGEVIDKLEVSPGPEWVNTSTNYNFSAGCIVYGAGKFIALTGSGYDKKVAYSEDGINWTTIELDLSEELRCTSAAYGGGRFIAINRDSSMALYSDDGIKWVEFEMPSSMQPFSITYGNGKFVAIEASNDSEKVAVSSDGGNNWTVGKMPKIRTTDSNYEAPWQFITYGEGKFLAASPYINADWNITNAVAVSEDGLNWGNISTDFYGIESITYGKGKFLISGGEYNYSSYVANDGTICWSSSTFGRSGMWYQMVYGNGKFVAPSWLSSRIAYSNDGINWTVSNSNINWESQAQILSYGDGKFVATSNGIYYYLLDVRPNL